MAALGGGDFKLPRMPPARPAPSRRDLILGRTLAVLMVAIVLAIAAVLVLRLKVWRDTAVTVPADTPLAKQCSGLDAATLDGARRLTIKAADGTTLGAAATGPQGASTAVVLRHGASQTICDWLPWAHEISMQTGYEVLLFDRRGRGSSPETGSLSAEPGDLGAAVAQVRAEGAEQVALVASSMGNSIMYAALPDLPSPPCAVVSISPVLISGDSRGQVRGDALEQLAANTWVAYETKNQTIADAAASIEKAALAQGNPAPRMLAVDTSDHSRQLLAKHREVAAFVRDGIASCH